MAEDELEHRLRPGRDPRAREPVRERAVAQPAERFPADEGAVRQHRHAPLARERQQLRAIVEYLKPAHTHFVDLVEPLPPVLPNHWELGLSDLGETTDLH